MKLLLASHLLNETHERAFEDLLGSSKVSKALFVTSAAVPYGLEKKPEWLQETLDQMALFTESFDEVSLEEDVPDDISEYDFIFVSGGNTFYLAYKLEQTGFGEKLKRYIENNRVYVGSSAGSIILGENLEPIADADDPKKAPELCNGLNMMKEIVVPHVGGEHYGHIMDGVIEKYENLGIETIPLRDDQVYLVNGENKKVI